MDINKDKIIEFVKDQCRDKYYSPDMAIHMFSEDSLLVKDLLLDELDIVELAMDVERQFNIKINDSALLDENCKVKDIINNIL